METKLTDVGLKELKALKSLQKLQLGSMRVTSRGLKTSVRYSFSCGGDEPAIGV